MHQPEYFSQYGQDEYCYQHFFRDTKNGFFIEIGADNGIKGSNTLFFERYLDWDGICIEPSPDRFLELKKNRDCICENVAVSDRAETVEFLDIQGYGRGLSGIIKHYPEAHLQRIERELKLPEARTSRKSKVTVEAVCLNDLLEKHDVRHIDLCSIDTEGSELNILSSIDFDRYRFDVLIIENNYNQNLSDILEKWGFVWKGKLVIDDVYQHLDMKKS